MAVYDSQPRTLQEYTRIVAASGVEVLPCVGEFVFVVEAAIELRVVIGGKSFKLMEGDHIRVERFRDLELHNLRSDVDITVRVIVGFGEFDRRIIRGEITAVPGILGADGTYRPDTRYELPLSLVHKPGSGVTETAAAKVKDVVTLALDVAQGGLYFDPAADSRALVGILDNPGGGTHWYIYALDVQSGALELLSDTVAGDFDVAPSAAYAWAWDSDYYYMSGYEGFSPRIGRIWRMPRYVGSGTWTTLVQDQGDIIQGIAFDGSDIIYITDTEFLRRVNALGVVTTSVFIGTGKSGGTYVMFRRGSEIWASGFGTFYKYDIDTFAYLGNAAGTYNATNNQHAATPWYYWLLTNNTTGVDRKNIDLQAPETTTIDLVGVAYERACGGHQMIKKPGEFEANRSSAVIEVVVGLGTARVDGEIIKMALEWYSARTVTADYMDHVFSIEIISALAGGRGSPRTKTVQANGMSLSAAGIVDFFTATLPAQVKLTLDNGLEYE